VSAFSIDAETGKLTLLNQRSSGGDGPCHLVLDKDQKNVLVANYGGGSVGVLPVLPDGTLGETNAFIQHAGKSVNPSRQEKPHAHCVALDPANRFAFVCDLGIDKVMIYHFDSARGTLTPNDPPFFQAKPGAGSRHLAFHPNGRFAYLVNELDSSMTALAYDASRGELRELQTLPMLPDDFKGDNLAAEVVVHPSGKFLYSSNRGHDSIVHFDIDRKKGTLKFVERQPTAGKTPRHFAIDPTGKFLMVANQDSGNVVVFAINPRDGRLTKTGQTLEVPSPVCVKFFEGR
jgi:6-phosphogluconolactonase